MEEIGADWIYDRPIRLFELRDWAWEDPGSLAKPFTLFVAGSFAGEDGAAISRFAEGAIASGCRWMHAWGEGSESLDHQFDHVAITSDVFVMTSWDEEDSLAAALAVALRAFPEEVTETSSWESSPAILAIQEPWVAEVRHLVAEHDELEAY